MRWPVASLGEICQINIGRTPSRSVPAYWEGGSHPWLSISDMGRAKEISKTKEGITETAINDCNMRLVQPGTVLFSFKLSIGKLGIAAVPLFTNEAIASLLILDRDCLCEEYLFHALQEASRRVVGDRAAMGITLNKASLAQIEIPLPPLEEQRRIAAILDKANELNRLRECHQFLCRNVELSIFYKEFGSPGTNPFGWPTVPLAEMAEIFSDGPFGSNLKSSHYVKSGIRVVRLQNIGKGDFLEDDKAFVDLSHYETIKKHSCLPGDILIGTLGDPNLRACILPDSIPVAIIKADCIQMRCDTSRSTAAYVTHLLNLPEVNQMASSLILGQTRGRISMGRLKGFEVPMPPLDKQIQFARKIRALNSLRKIDASSASSIRDLIDSFSSRALAPKHCQ